MQNQPDQREALAPALEEALAPARGILTGLLLSVLLFWTPALVLLRLLR
jgi:hypothetical protein